MKTSNAKKAAGSCCCAYACKSPPAERKGGLCHKHYARRRKERDPVYNRYENFKGNARRRGKEFTITLEEFRLFCKRTGYIIKKGMRGRAATIDRRCNLHGYHIWNIQILTMSQNLNKWLNHDRYLTTSGAEDCPF